MKIQCPCGAKYVIDVTPGMPPVQFVCASCGRDYSQFINELIQRESGEQNPAATASAPRLKISHDRPAAPPPSSPPPPPAPGAQRKKQITESFAREKRFWRKAGWLFGVVVALAVLAIGAWTWYAWFASVPHVVFSAHFDQEAFSGNSYVTNGQIIFLHGDTLARYDLKTKKSVWSLELVTKHDVADVLKREDEERAAARAQGGRSDYSHIELPSIREKYARADLDSELSLHVAGKNIWVAQNNTLTHYDWDSGKMLQEITLTNGVEKIAARGGDLIASGISENGAEWLTRVDMSSGQTSAEKISLSGSGGVLAQNSPPENGAPQNSENNNGGGLPLSPYAPSQPLNPGKVQEQAQHLTPAARMALPALLANNSYNQRIENQLNGNQKKNPPPQNYQPQRNSFEPRQATSSHVENFHLIPDGDSYVEFASRLVKAHFVQREAMKAPPRKSALDNPNLTGSSTPDVANEILNNMQRNAGGDKVTENQSSYHVAIRRPGAASPDWAGDVTGPPALFPLKTVNVLIAGKTVIVFDKSNKKLWQAELTYPVSTDDAGKFSPYGEGPCAENDGVLFVFDQAVLTAFDANSGNVRWRLPSVGIVGLFFGDDGMLYVNTTTGNPDDIKYSRQIDISKKTEIVALKIDPKTGKTLWSIEPHGLIRYVSGPFIYSTYSFDPGDKEDQLSDATAGLENPPFLRITRINPKDGRVIWEHTEARAPVNMEFNKNSIRLIFKKEVDVLRYLTL